jgi:ABC-2 type transport system permease protein
VTAVTPTRREVTVSPVSPVRVLSSEWIKLRSLRSTGYTLLAAFVAMVLLGCVVGWATNSHWSRIDPEERAHFSPIDSSLAGYHLAQLAVVVLGVLLITGEYATGMVRATFGAVPTRLPVLWAKAVLYAGVTFVVTIAAAFLAFLGGQHFLASHGTTLSATHALRDIVGVAGYLTLIAVLAVASGFILRSTAGGIAALFGLLLVLPGVGQVLPTSWQRHTLPYLPSNAGASIFTEHTDPGMLTPGPGLLVIAIWVVVVLAIAAVVLQRRDA